VKHRFRALTSTVEVEVRDGFVGAALAELLVAGYVSVLEEPAFSYILTDEGVTGVGRYKDLAATPIDVVPMFELDLYQQVAVQAAPGWLLHAAALEYEGGAYVFAGPSGAGKTTLTLELMNRGWRLITEEMVLIDRQLAVHGLARPIHAPLAGSHRDRIPAAWRSANYPIRVGETTNLSIIVQPPLEARIREPVPLRRLVRLDHGAQLQPSIDAMPPHSALPRLWECTLRSDAAALAMASHIMSRSHPLQLHSSTAAEAAVQAFEITQLTGK